MEDDYGVLPTPKFFEEEDYYGTHLDGVISAQMILNTQPEEELSRTGTTTEALNAYSRQIVIPAIYDTVLKNKVDRDEESSRMLDLILEGRRFSFDSFDESGFTLSPYHALRGNIQNGARNIASYYQKNEKLCNKWIDRIIKACEKAN